MAQSRPPRFGSERRPCWLGLAVLLAVLLVGLPGCDAPYEKKSGTWQYDGRPITVKPASAFVPLKGPFARSTEGGYYRGSLIDGSEGASVANHK